MLMSYLMQSDDASVAVVVIAAVIGLAIGIVELIALWKVFTKAGKPGIACIVPIWNIICMLQITGNPVWYILLLVVPGANIYVAIKLVLDLAKVFGKSLGFGFGLLFLSPIFIPVLGFGDAEYQLPQAV